MNDMGDIKSLEVRLVNLEHRVGVHAENIATLMRRLDEHGETLLGIKTLIMQIKWLFVGFMLFFVANQVGILPALAKVIGVP